MKPIFVIGHKNPDTDSICSAISYAYLKKKITGDPYIACRAGAVNNETKYVLDCFGVAEPQLVQSLEPRVADVQYRKVEGISRRVSLKRAWEHMRDNQIQTIPVLTKWGQLKGIVTLGDVARFYMEDQGADALAEARTSYRNIVETLKGEMIVGDPDAYFTQGKVVVAAANPDVMEDYICEHDMVILGNRYEGQLSAIEMKADCIVVCLGSQVTKSIQKLAEEAGCAVICSPLDTYTCAKLINQAVPVRHVMRTDDIIYFRESHLVSDVKSTVSKLRIRYYPVLDEDGRYVGMLSQRNLLDVERQRVILVDHNEQGQAVDGIKDTEVIEIIDHHRIDPVETMNPIYFRNQPLGCTATIITMMYQENGVEIPPAIAGLLCSAILSDTLMFRSPTCTPVDQAMARNLAKIAGINMEAHASAMFSAASQLQDKTPDEIFHIDCKRFQCSDKSIAVAQVTGMSKEELKRVKEEMLPYLKEALPSSGMDMLFLLLTNILEQSSELLFAGTGARDTVSTAFPSIECGEDSILLPGVVSRKKQLIGPLMSAIEANGE